MAAYEDNATVKVIVTTPMSQNVSALLAGNVRWNTVDPRTGEVVVDWAFNKINNDNGTQKWSALQYDAIYEAFDNYSAVANIRFQYIANPQRDDSGNVVNAEIVFYKTSVNEDFGGTSGFPLWAASSGTTSEANGYQVAKPGQVAMWLNPFSEVGNFRNSGVDAFGNPKTLFPNFNGDAVTTAGFETITHEIGHTLGLKHPHSDGPGSTTLFEGVGDDSSIKVESDLGTNKLNQTLYSVMSYNHPTYTVGGNVQMEFVKGPMAYDIAALQILYGANTSHNSSSNSYTLSSDLSGPAVFSCIWDTGGIDSINYYGNDHAFIDLRAATLDDGVGGGGYLSYVKNDAGKIGGGFTIAGDILGILADQGTEHGVVIENASGGSNDDTITGNGANNVLKGNGGRDLLQGLDGNDTLDGGTGADWMYGGNGNDLFIVDNVNDFISDGGTDGGIDTVQTSLGSFSLTGNADIENLTYTGAGTFSGTGNDLSNVITGGAQGDTLWGLGGSDTLNGMGGNDTLKGGGGSDILDGGTGADYMAGEDGNDTYRVDNIGDTVVESRNGGIDTVQTTLTSYALGFNVENLRFDGNGSFTGTGNDLNNLIIGGASADTLKGGGGDDTLMGLDGNDVFYGGAGSDTVDYSFESRGVTANLTTGRGTVGGFTDTFSSIENLTAGLGNDNFTGNGQDNRFTYVGSFLGNHETGQTISDTGGIDTYAGGNGSDTIDFSRFVGDLSIDLRDGVASSGYFYSSVAEGGGGTSGFVVRLVANFTSIENAVGGNGDDRITGDQNANVLDGGLGNDTLSGGAGNDTLIGGAGADTFQFLNGWGHDTIKDFSFSDGDRIDMSGVTGLTAFSQLSITSQGGNAVVTFGQDSIVLTGVAPGNVASSWFVFPSSNSATSTSTANAADAGGTSAPAEVGQVSQGVASAANVETNAPAEPRASDGAYGSAPTGFDFSGLQPQFHLPDLAVVLQQIVPEVATLLEPLHNLTDFLRGGIEQADAAAASRSDSHAVNIVDLLSGQVGGNSYVSPHPEFHL